MPDPADHLIATIEAESLGKAFIADVFAVGIAAASEEWLERPDVHAIDSQPRGIEVRATLRGQRVTVAIDLVLRAWVGRTRPETNEPTQ
jgi:hypothetical protein